MRSIFQVTYFYYEFHSDVKHLKMLQRRIETRRFIFYNRRRHFVSRRM